MSFSRLCVYGNQGVSICSLCTSVNQGVSFCGVCTYVNHRLGFCRCFYVCQVSSRGRTVSSSSSEGDEFLTRSLQQGTIREAMAVGAVVHATHSSSSDSSRTVQDKHAQNSGMSPLYNHISLVFAKAFIIHSLLWDQVDIGIILPDFFCLII